MLSAAATLGPLPSVDAIPATNVEEAAPRPGAAAYFPQVEDLRVDLGSYVSAWGSAQALLSHKRGCQHRGRADPLPLFHPSLVRRSLS